MSLTKYFWNKLNEIMIAEDVMLHELKTDPESFGATLIGKKPYEIRINDRGFRVGEFLWLRETIHTGEQMKPSDTSTGKPLLYTGRELVVKIIHMMCDMYGLKDGWCILAIDVNKIQGG